MKNLIYLLILLLFLSCTKESIEDCCPVCAFPASKEQLKQTMYEGNKKDNFEIITRFYDCSNCGNQYELISKKYR